MNILIADQLDKSYGIKPLFKDLSFSIHAGERIGVVGINGTGKSTLLRILAGVETADSGNVSSSNSLQIAYLPQNPDYDPAATVMEQVLAQLPLLPSLFARYYGLQDQLALQPNDADLQHELEKLNQEMDNERAWLIDAEAKSLLSKLGVTELQAQMGTLSGGQRKRVMLAATLLLPCGLLILDEPTNHLDTEAVEWLEQYLTRNKAALLMITHDRYFLDRVANRIIELDQGQLYSYDGNYQQFLELKALRMEQQRTAEHKRQQLYRQELDWVRRGAKARTTKQKARLDRFDQLQASAPEAESGSLDIALAGSRLGKKVIELNDIEKRIPGRTLIQSFSLLIQKHDRIGIVGPNGGGKSTLLDIISGRIQPDGGSLSQGSTVKIGYFTQEAVEMDPDQRVIEYIKEAAEVVRLADGASISAAQMLERFLFPSASQWNTISNLSGGEKRRLYLLRILMGAPNVLLLDEPTNDLDIQTLTILEDYLDDFPGAVITVSHDRYFLNRMAEKIIGFENNGQLQQHVGDYSDYRQWQKTREQQLAQAEAQSLPQDTASAARPSRATTRALKFTYAEQKEYEQIDEKIEATEQRIVDLEQMMSQAHSDFERLQQLTSDQQQAEADLLHLMERWTYLNELAEEIERQKADKA